MRPENITSSGSTYHLSMDIKDDLVKFNNAISQKNIDAIINNPTLFFIAFLKSCKEFYGKMERPNPNFGCLADVIKGDTIKTSEVKVKFIKEDLEKIRACFVKGLKDDTVSCSINQSSYKLLEENKELSSFSRDIETVFPTFSQLFGKLTINDVKVKRQNMLDADLYEYGEIFVDEFFMEKVKCYTINLEKIKV